jgi:DNA gyrase subunit B
MNRDYGAEIDALQSEIRELTSLIKSSFPKMLESLKTNPKFAADVSPEKQSGEKAYVMRGMHPDSRLSDLMEEMCNDVNEKGGTGRVIYLGVFASGDGDNCRQSNWIRKTINTDTLLELIDSGNALTVMNCINSQERLNLLLAILRQPSNVAQLTEKLGASSSGQIYHHLRPLLAADLIKEDDKQRGLYHVVSHRVQGIIMLLVGISDMLDPTITQGNWGENV